MIKGEVVGSLITTRLTSCKQNLKLNSCNLDIREYFFSQRVVNMWNSLPDDVKESTTLNMFKNKLDDFLSDTLSDWS